MISGSYETINDVYVSSNDPNTYLAATPYSMVRQFHQAMSQDLDQEYKQNSSLDRLRMKLVSEEFDEVASAETPDNLLKELADLVYVTYGYAATFGWDLDEALRRTHASNMSKLDENGNPVFREDGKVLKGVNYEEPDMSDLAA